MDNNLEKKEEEKEKEKGDELYRITMTREAEKALGDMLEKANSGFIGGKINRTQLVSWTLIKMSQDINESSLQELRSAHFDDISALESLFRKAKDSGEISPELREILMKEIGFAAPSKRAGKNKVDK
ncbi:MAG: hypothetical protein KF799_00735 [Bdellovibrionales bacterium]|nr:hypothetical protein [Bdellovibrionales bacterium]